MTHASAPVVCRRWTLGGSVYEAQCKILVCDLREVWSLGGIAGGVRHIQLTLLTLNLIVIRDKS